MALAVPFFFHKKRLLIHLLAVVLAVVCLVGMLSRTAQATNTYVITDGDAVRFHTTHATDPAKVLQEAGVSLSKDDYFITRPGNGVSEISIQRAQNITVFYCGQAMQTSSHGETVQALLTRLGLILDDSMAVSLPCLISVEGDINTPRLPSYKIRKTLTENSVAFLTFADFADQDPAHYGLSGSATQVERIFPPEKVSQKQDLTGDAHEQAAALFQLLNQQKML
jgi:hypothetical protein